MAKDRFVEVYSQGVSNVEKIIVDTQTGVNYVLASSALTVGCGMSVLVDADGKPIVTPHKLNRRKDNKYNITWHKSCLSAFQNKQE